jgi:gluconate 2-dehydrogenase gamma chain
VSSRRSFLTNVAGFGTAIGVADYALVEEALAHAARAVTIQPRPAFKVLSASEASELEAITARIIPTTETPGAREAGVVWFIDQALTTFQKDALVPLRRGLADLKPRAATRNRGAASFAALSVAHQDAVLQEIETTDFFGQLKFLTFMGMFGEPSYGGNRNEVGWKLLDFRPHGPHQPPFGYYDAQATRR